MTGLNRNVVLAAMAGIGLSVPMSAELGIQRRKPSRNISLAGFSGGNRGKGRNKNPRRFTGVAAAKRAAIKARNRRAK